MLGLDEPSRNKILWKLSASATHLQRKARVFEVGLEDAGTTQRVEENYYVFPGYATLNVCERITDFRAF